jgi:hypothetical protein
MIIDYSGSVGTLVGDVRQHLANGRLSSSLADATYAIGYGDNAVLGRSAFAGVEVDSTSVLIKFTYGGDANLDGQVDVTDLGALATNWQSTTAVWTDGDFNYDAHVDVTDLGILATNWQRGVGSPLSQEGGGPDTQQEFLDGIEGLGLSQGQIDDLLAALGSGGGPIL